MGNGLLTFIDKKTKYSDFFKNDEMIFYDNLDELSEKINKYAIDDKQRRLIAKKGHYKYHKFFNSEIIANYIISKTMGLSTKFYWEK